MIAFTLINIILTLVTDIICQFTKAYFVEIQEIVDNNHTGEEQTWPSLYVQVGYLTTLSVAKIV